jgi:coenzyme F420-reducing hydrogenase alpha subunit
MVLGEWISSHSLSYFFLTLPDFVGTEGGVFDLRNHHPEISTRPFPCAGLPCTWCSSSAGGILIR